MPADPAPLLKDFTQRPILISEGLHKSVMKESSMKDCCTAH